MHIREGNIQDWPFIYELAQKVIPDSVSPWRQQAIEETIKFRDKNLAGLWNWIQQTNSQVFIAEKTEGKNRLKLGYLILCPETIEELTGLGQAWIMDIAVIPFQRNSGAATALLESAEKYCRESRIDYLGLAVSSHNLKALRLYEKLGFAEERKLMVKVLKKSLRQLGRK
ncbi:MAG: GNAT family N-acetyltransferase [Desulfitobacteriaceae bacterium]|nr:GNAT family N-acetyltransferase [Desulfitobacteriaceae bacterium]